MKLNLSVLTLLLSFYLGTIAAPAASAAACPSTDPNDVMVPVGPWCVDKYGATVCDSSKTGAAFDQSCISSTNGNNGTAKEDPKNLLLQKIDPQGKLLDTHYRAYSKKGLVPTRFIDYYQALTACTNAGKEVIPDSIRIGAALGTFYPGPNDGLKNTRCNTKSDSPRATGLAGNTPGGEDSCISQWGVEDMVGNVFEWTGLTSSVMAADWGTSFDSKVATGLAAPAAAIPGKPPIDSPAVVLRGGSFGFGAPGGVFTMVMTVPGSHALAATGFRCAKLARE
jgi:hypothetical protein